jgi:hypothetical protein
MPAVTTGVRVGSLRLEDPPPLLAVTTARIV